MSAIPNARLTGCSSKQPQEREAWKWYLSSFSPLGAFHIKVEWNLIQGGQTEARSPVEVMIAPLPVHGYLDEAYKSI